MFTPKSRWEDYTARMFDVRAATPEEREKNQAEARGKEEERRTKEKIFEKHLFAVAVPLGLIAIVLGAFLLIQSIGTGLMFGGIFSLCDGYVNYWNELADALKFTSLVIAFVILLIVGYLKIERKDTSTA